MSIASRIDGLFFSRKSATPFGLLRIVWAAVLLCAALRIAPDVLRYYSDGSFLPRFLEPLVLRGTFRFSLLDEIGDPAGVLFIYMAFIFSLFAVLLGIRPRLWTLVSTVLLFSFHERNPLILGGGDALLRAIGFLLTIAPGIEALSLWRAKKQWAVWKHDEKLLPPLTMPAWPKRLLQWQVIVVYAFSLLNKLMSTAWVQGSAAALILSNPVFSRVNVSHFTLDAWSPLLTYSTLFFEGAWLLLLVPASAFDRVPSLKKRVFRRWLLGIGAVFHVVIFALLRVGTFSPAMLVAYTGLLEGEDVEALRHWWNARWKKHSRVKRGGILVFHDGHCGLCRRSAFVLLQMDWLHRLTSVNYQIAANRKKAAPDLTLKELDRAMHVRLPNGRTKEGYRAFRLLAWHLPPLWLCIPLLYLPGATVIGDRLYYFIASRRLRCTHEYCAL